MSKYDRNNKCLFCFNFNGLKKVSDIFISHNDNVKYTYLDIVNKCFRIQFLDKNLESDNLICSKCIAKLKYCYSFRKDVERAHQKLYKIIQTNDANKPNNSTYGENIRHKDTFENIPKQQSHQDIWIDTFNTEKQCSDDQNDSDDNNSVCDMREEPYRSDWSVDTDDVLSATGYWNEIKHIKERKKFYIPPLDRKTDKCPVCCRVFKLHSSLLSHYSRHYPSFICEICGNTYASSTMFNNHSLTHVDASFKCSQCSRDFKNVRDRKAHVKQVHKGIYHYKCYICKKRFKRYPERQRHLITEHNLEQAKWKCQHCDFNYQFPGELREHVKEIHFNKWKWKCYECCVVFLSHCEMNRHFIKHTDNKDFHCQYCGKEFSRKNTLTEHLKIHLNIKKYVCSECGKAFVQKAALKGHIRIHYK